LPKTHVWRLEGPITSGEENWVFTALGSGYSQLSAEGQPDYARISRVGKDPSRHPQEVVFDPSRRLLNGVKNIHGNRDKKVGKRKMKKNTNRILKVQAKH
jgi:hypothetical protein